MSDVAHLGPVELLTPTAERSLAFFVDVLGMEIEGQEGGSVYLRGWGDYQRYSLVLTESAQSGMAWLGLRASSPEALRAPRRGGPGQRPRGGLERGRPRARTRPTASATPTATASSSTTSASATTRPSICARR